MRLTRRQRAKDFDEKATLLTPRFDEEAAQRAHRVVPLGASAREDLTAARRDLTTIQSGWLTKQSNAPSGSARWGDLLPPRVSRRVSRAAARRRAADWKPALLVVPLLLAAVIAALTLAKQESARTAETNVAAETTVGAGRVVGAATATGAGAPERFMVVPVIRPADARVRRGSGRAARVSSAGVEGEFAGEFVIPAEASDGGGRRRERGRRRAGGAQELERIAERFGRGREVREFGDLLREIERD